MLTWILAKWEGWQFSSVDTIYLPSEIGEWSYGTLRGSSTWICLPNSGKLILRSWPALNWEVRYWRSKRHRCQMASWWTSSQTGQDSVESVANRLEAQQQQLEDWQNAVSDARSKHYFLPLGLLVPGGSLTAWFAADLMLFPSNFSDLWVIQKKAGSIYHSLNVSLTL